MTTARPASRAPIQDTRPTHASAFWRGFSRPVPESHEDVVRIVCGRGATVRDADGREYLDATASLWYSAVGYGRQEIAAAVGEQLARLHAYSTFGEFSNDRAEALAERLVALSPMERAKVFLGSGGSDGIETASKLARRHWHAAGRPEKRIVVSFAGGYHGMHGFGTALAGIESNREGYGDIVPETVQITPYDTAALERLVSRVGADRIAALVGEPVQGAGGVRIPAPDAWRDLADRCRAHEILLVADEVVTGFGRLGRWFGSERFGVVPDAIVFAKGVTSGYLPLGGVIAGPRILETFAEGTGELWRHGYTYSGHAAACTAALANLEIFEREQLVERVASHEPRFAAMLARLGEHPLIRETRAIGMMGAAELDRTAVAADPSLPTRAIVAARRAGVLTRVIGGPSIHLSPPLVTSTEQIDEIGARLLTALDEVST